MENVEEVINRDHFPHRLALTEVKIDELVYKEEIKNEYISKRQLGPNQHLHKMYAFNQDSLLANFFYLGQRTRFLFLFRRVHGCNHKHSCFEHVVRKIFNWVLCYGVCRIPLYYFVKNMSTEGGEHMMDKGSFLMGELIMLILVGGLSAAGCFLRYFNEDIVNPR
mmetsp:Transcript_31009/g.30467  ORF Transcript_31009/g.30467 Transcript_31009/m.30467 type:complete len:165 (+) Transcript_31009:280-774(+)